MAKIPDMYFTVSKVDPIRVKCARLGCSNDGQTRNEITCSTGPVVPDMPPYVKAYLCDSCYDEIRGPKPAHAISKQTRPDALHVYHNGPKCVFDGCDNAGTVEVHDAEAFGEHSITVKICEDCYGRVVYPWLVARQNELNERATKSTHRLSIDPEAGA